MKKEIEIKEAVEILKSYKDIEFKPTNYSEKEAVGITPEKNQKGNPQALIVRKKDSKFGVYLKPLSSGVVLKYPVDNNWKSHRIATAKDFENCLDALVSAEDKESLRKLLEKAKN